MTGWYNDNDIQRIINAGLNGIVPRGRVRLYLPDLQLGELRERHLSRKRAMAELLNQAASAWDFEKRRRYGPTSPHDVKALRAVECASRELVEILDARGHGQRHVKASRETLLFQLALAAERMGPDLGPYPAAVPVTWPVEGEDLGVTIYGGEEQLQADIAAAHRLNTWARNTRAQLRGVRSKSRGGQVDRPTDILVNRILDIWTVVLGKKPRISQSDDGTAPTGPLLRFVKACLEPLGVKLSPQAVRERVRNYRNPSRRRRRRPTRSDRPRVANKPR